MAACRNIRIAIALTILAPATHATPPAHGQWEPIRQLSDEFELQGLDTAKWQDHHPYYSGKAPGVYSPRNVFIHEGKLLLAAREDTSSGQAQITTSIVRSHNKVKYGYFEAKAKAMPSHLVSAFWFYEYTDSGTYEIDVIEMAGRAPGRENIFHSNAHVYYGDPRLESDQNRISSPRRWQTPAPVADDYHLYGLEWDEHWLHWYFDGQRIRSMPNRHWHVPMRLIFTAETHPDWMGMPKSGELPAAFRVEYVRAWRRVDGP